MKWGIAILLILGLVAAASAALLMGTLKLGSSAPGENQSESIEVAMAKLSMRAASVITLENINTEKVSRDELPEGKLVSPLQVIGRVLAIPVFEGQVLTESCFIKDGTGALLAAQIPDGMRGFSVAVSSKAMPDRILLYPGCIVDVLVCYKSSNRTSGEDAISQTMLVGIHVLAISGDSVIATPEEDGEAKKRSSSRGGTIVTLMVSPGQAEALQLAVENGTITMSLRNPLDDVPVDEEGSVLNRESLFRKGDTLAPTIQSEQWFDTDNQQDQRTTSNNPQQEGSEDGVPGTIGSVHQPKSTNKSQNSKNSRWEVEVISGREKKVADFDAPENTADKTTAKNKI